MMLRDAIDDHQEALIPQQVFQELAGNRGILQPASQLLMDHKRKISKVLVNPYGSHRMSEDFPRLSTPAPDPGGQGRLARASRSNDLDRRTRMP